MQGKCLAAAYMKTVTNLPQLVQFCSAEESSRASGSSSLVGAVRSSYQNLKQRGRAKSFGTPNGNYAKPRPSVCHRCDGAPHSKWTEEVLKAECPAFSVTCAMCKRRGHFTSLCHRNTAGSSGNPALAALEQSEEGPTEEDDPYNVEELGTYAFC